MDVVDPTAVLVARDVSKWFGDVVAVNGATFGVRPGVTALLGPNGAGKSTMLRLLCGLTRPSRGTIRVLGRDPRRDPGVLGRIGLAPQQERLLEVDSAFEFVRLAAVLQGLAGPDERARAALARVELDPGDRRRLSTYSKGMRQRVKLAQAIVHDPEVLLLDEPLAGLDPRQRARMIDLVHGLGDTGVCVLVSSHVLEEVERFGSRVLVMAQGRLAAEGDFRAIRELMDDRPHRIRVRTDQARTLAAELVARELVVGVRLDDATTLILDTRDVHAFRRAVAGLARHHDARLLEVAPLDEDLESVFRYVVGAP